MPCFLRGALCRGNSITPSTRLTLSCCLQTGQFAFMCPLSVASRRCRAPRTGRRLPSHSSFIHSPEIVRCLSLARPTSGKSPTARERIAAGQARQSRILRRYGGWSPLPGLPRAHGYGRAARGRDKGYGDEDAGNPDFLPECRFLGERGEAKLGESPERVAESRDRRPESARSATA